MPIRLLLIALVMMSLAVQTPERHDKYKDDAGAYCWHPRSGTPSQNDHREHDAHGHKCTCRLVCQLDEGGRVVGDEEDATCELYCTRSKCQCHPEDRCEKS